MGPTIRRMLVAGVAPLVAAVPGLVVLVRDWDRIPATVASHFTLSGAANGTAGRWSLVVLLVAVPLVLAAAFGTVAVAGEPARQGRAYPARWLPAVSWGASVLVGGLGLLVVLANVDVTDPLAATLPLTGLLGVVAAALGAGLLGALLAPAAQPGGPVPPPPVIRLGRTERVSWTGRCRSTVLAVLGALMVAAGPAIGLLGTWVAGVVLLVAGLFLLWGSTITVTVDRTGLRVGMGPLGFPTLRVPLADVAEVHSEHVVPPAYGGWGLRFVPGTTAVVLRSGPGMIVTRRSGRTLVVTVEDAETAAGLLNGLRERSC